MGIVGEDRKQREKYVSNNSSTTQFDYLRNYNAMDNVSGHFMTEGSPIDANSEKELVYYFSKKYYRLIQAVEKNMILCILCF